MSLNENETIENRYSKLCIDLNMDSETKEDAWRCYEHIRKHYVLEGDQLHWLAVSLYVSCRKNKYLSTSDNNPISISRLLKSSNNFELFIFFDKLHKWEDMANLPDSIRNKIDQVEHSFNISSIIFQKYTNIFIFIFGGNNSKFVYSDYQYQINPKLILKNKQKKCSYQHLYSLIWTIYALAKTIYPSTINDLIASFHLLIASFIFVYIHSKKAKLFHLLKGECLKELNDRDESIIDKLCIEYGCSSEMTRTIYEEHLKNELFKRFLNSNEILNENKFVEIIIDINRQYDEIVLTNCIIDERIFLENKIQLNDLLNPLNENRYSKSFDNRTPVTANQHFISSDQQNDLLTPISQSNYLIKLLFSIIGEQQTLPNNQLRELIGQKTFLDDLIQRIELWENIFIQEYHSIYTYSNQIHLFNQQNPSYSSKYRFDLALKLFYNGLTNILTIEKKRFHSINHFDQQQIQQSFQNNSFINGFSNDSNFWNDIQSKGILLFHQISNQFNTPTHSNYTQMYLQSPNHSNVSRKLFSNSNDNHNNNCLSIIRSRSDPLIENSSINVVKMSPYKMFYRKLYELVLSRLDIICLRLYGVESNQFEKFVWNIFLYLFVNYTELLFRSRDLDQILLSTIYYTANSNLFQFNKEELTWFRLIQVYKSMPNSKLKTLRSVFIRSINKNENILNEQTFDKNPCLTPSKPAGTIHIIDGNLIGDITSFYKEIFLKIENLEKNLQIYFENNKLIDIPIRNKIVQNQDEHISINIGQNIFVDYSSNQIKSNLFSSTNQQNKSISINNNSNNSSNVLSSSIQAGANNTVRTTRTRTEDGKFLTTISTISKLNNSNDKIENVIINKNEKNLLFGQSSNNSIKRTLSDDSNSNCLTSLTKKVLQIENDRQKFQDY